MVKRGLLTMSAVLVLGGLSWAGTADLKKGEFQGFGMGGAGGIFTCAVSPDDSNLMFVSSDMSGVYRSTDAGKSWTMLHRLQLNFSLHSRPFFAKGAMYWCSDAVLKVSKDNGLTWSEVVQGKPAWGRITDIGATDAGVIVVGCGSGVWAGGNGLAWTKVAERSETKGDQIGARTTVVDGTIYTVANNKLMQSKDGKAWTDIVVAPAGENPISALAGASVKGSPTLVAVVKSVGIVKSDDGGKTWAVIYAGTPDTTIRDVVMSSKQNTVIYASATVKGGGRGELPTAVLKTEDGGKTWNSVFDMKKNVEQSWVQTLLSWGYEVTDFGLGVDPNKPEVALVATQGDFYISTDGGKSWKQHINQALGAQPGDPGLRWKTIGLEVTSVWGYEIDPNDPNRHYIRYTDIGFARSVDKGESFISASKGCPWSNTFYELAFDPFVSGRLYAACSGRHDIPHWMHVSSNADGAGRSRGGVCVSDNYAQTWAVLNKELPNVPCTGLVVDPKSTKDKLTMYATFYEDGVYKTTDGGKTWVKKSNGLGHQGNMHVLRVKISPTSGNLYCVETAMRKGGSGFPVVGGLFKSTDGGENWTSMTEKFHWPTDMAIDPKNEDIIYLATSSVPGGSEGGLWKTTDGGKNWTQIVNDKEAAKWGGPSYVQGMLVKLHPDKSDTVYFGTAGNGLAVSKDAGKTWEPFKKIPFGLVQNMTFLPTDHNIIYVTTFGGGIWKGQALPIND